MKELAFRGLQRLPRWGGVLAVFVLLALAAWLLALAGQYQASPPAPRGDESYLFRLLSGHALSVAIPGAAVTMDASAAPYAATARVISWLALAWLLATALLWLVRRRLASHLAASLPGHLLVWGDGAAARDALFVNHRAGKAGIGLLPQTEPALEAELDAARIAWCSAGRAEKILTQTLSCPGATAFACDESDTVNIDLVEQVGRYLRHNDAAQGVGLIVRISDGPLRRRLSHRFSSRPELRKIRLIIYSDHELRARIAARLVPAFHFCHGDQPDVAHLVISGNGYAAEVMLVHLLKTMIFPPGKQVLFSVVSRDAGRLQEDFKSRFVELAAHREVDFHSLDPGRATDWASWLLMQAETGRRPTGWYFVHSDAASALGRALALEDAYRVVGEFAPPMVLLSPEGAGGKEAILSDSPLLRVVGGVSRVVDGDLVSQHRLDEMAAAIQAGYLAECQAAGERIGDRESLYEWRDLAENFKDENRDQAEHNLIKLRLLSWAVSEAAAVDTASWPVIPGQSLELLSITEHDRWLASRQARNWVYASERDDAALRHPDIVPWATLPEPRREIDRVMIRQVPRLLASMGQSAQERVYCLLETAGDAVFSASALEHCEAELRRSFSHCVPVFVGDPASGAAVELFRRYGGKGEFIALVDAQVQQGISEDILRRSSAVWVPGEDRSAAALSRLLPDLAPLWLTFTLDPGGEVRSASAHFGAVGEGDS